MYAKITFFLLLGLGLLLASCGYRTSATGGSPPTATGISGAPTSVTRITPGPGTSPTPRGTPTIASGLVTVRTSSSAYLPSDTINVTISNGSTKAIFFPNHQTDCSVVTLQLQVGPSWESLAPCKLMIVTKIQTLGARESMTISLRSGSSPWAAGNYRVAFRYSSMVPTGLQDVLTAFSPVFRVS